MAPFNVLKSSHGKLKLTHETLLASHEELLEQYASLIKVFLKKLKNNESSSHESSDQLQHVTNKVTKTKLATQGSYLSILLLNFFTSLLSSLFSFKRLVSQDIEVKQASIYEEHCIANKSSQEVDTCFLPTSHGLATLCD